MRVLRIIKCATCSFLRNLNIEIQEMFVLRKFKCHFLENLRLHERGENFVHDRATQLIWQHFICFVLKPLNI